MTNVVNGSNNAKASGSNSLWTNPYLLSGVAIAVITIMPTLVSVMFFCRQARLFNCWCLFLVEMAVGSLTTEAVVHLIPALIVKDKSVNTGVPHYFPYLATMSALVCVLHALDTASVVFFGRRQSSSHAMEWRESNQHTVEKQTNASMDSNNARNNLKSYLQASVEISNARREIHVTPRTQENRSVQSSSSQPIKYHGTHVRQDSYSLLDDVDNKFYCRKSSSLNEFRKVTRDSQPTMRDELSSGSSTAVESHEHRRESEATTIFEALKNPRNCLSDGPYRVCSILSAGAILHSFAHGLAIGAAYVKRWDYGLHLSVSVGLHELAHKVADFAVLTASGFSIKAVLLLNVCYFLTSMAGVMLAVPVSKKSMNLRLWITTIATAVFVYFSLVTMSSMVRRNYNPKNAMAFYVGNAGIIAGYLLTMLASLLEIYV